MQKLPFSQTLMGVVLAGLIVTIVGAYINRFLGVEPAASSSRSAAQPARAVAYPTTRNEPSPLPFFSARGFSYQRPKAIIHSPPPIGRAQKVTTRGEAELFHEDALNASDSTMNQTTSSLCQNSAMRVGSRALMTESPVNYSRDLRLILEDTPVKVLAAEGEFCKVDVDGELGYIREEYLYGRKSMTREELDAVASCITPGDAIFSSRTTLTEKPDLSSRTLLLALEGKPAKILGAYGNFCKVEVNGLRGFCLGSSLNRTDGIQ